VAPDQSRPFLVVTELGKNACGRQEPRKPGRGSHRSEIDRFRALRGLVPITLPGLADRHLPPISPDLPLLPTVTAR